MCPLACNLTVQKGCLPRTDQHMLSCCATGVQQVVVDLEDGSSTSGDVLVGADGIWSKIRKNLVGDTQPNYSGYTCYTGISDFTPADIDIVGYR